MREQKVAKFEEEKVQMAKKKKYLRLRVKDELEKSKMKIRSRSVFTIKQHMLDYYNFPKEVVMPSFRSTTMPSSP